MLYATGHEHTKSLVDYTLKYLDVPVDALYSTLGRTAARTLETKRSLLTRCRLAPTI